MHTWHDVHVPIGYDGFGDVDTYLDLPIGPGPSSPPGSPATPLAFSPATGADWYPVLVHLAAGTTIQRFADGTFFPAGVKPQDWDAVVHVPPIYREAGGTAPAYCTALVSTAFLAYFRPQNSPVAQALTQALSRLCISRQILPGTLATSFQAPATSPVATSTGTAEPQTVVVGVIDDGMAFANSRFRTADDRPRVEHVWLQDAVSNAAAGRYGYGRVLSKAGRAGEPGLDQIFAASSYSGLIDEDEVYARTGALTWGKRNGLELRTLALHASHGTAVMDLACGYRPGTAPKSPETKGADSRPIVCVQLPAATNEGTSGASLDTFVIDGVRFILDKADEIARARGCGPLPVVINLSYGTIAGRQDGTADMERAIDALIRARRGTAAPLQVVIAAGNHRLRKCHAEVTFNGGAGGSSVGMVKTLNWRVPPDSRAPHHLELWLPKPSSDTSARIKVRIRPPTGSFSPWIDDRTQPVKVWGPSAEHGLCYMRAAYFPAPTDRTMILISLKPTECAEDPVTGAIDLDSAPAGVWTIEVENVSLGASDVVEARIQRNDTRFGYLPFGRQSYFDDAHYVPVEENAPLRKANGRVPVADAPDSQIKRAGTMNAIASGEHVIVIGGYVGNTLEIADYSGEGPTSSTSRTGPDAVAPSDLSIAHAGILAAGTRSGATVALNGTSVAAPQITRLIADRMAAGQPADRTAIRALAAASEASLPNHPAPARGGQGRILLPDVGRMARIEH